MKYDTERRRERNQVSGGQIDPLSAPCRDGDRPPKAISIDTAASRDEEGVVPRRDWGLHK